MIEFLSYQTVPSTKRGCSGQVETRVEQAVRTCTNVKNRQTRSKDNAVDVVMKIIEKENLLENKILAIRLDPKYAVDKNLTGLIANGLLETYNRSVLLLNYTKDENGKVYWQGSGRGYDKGNLGSFRDALISSGLVSYAQGHDLAFGLSVEDSNFNKLITYFNELYKDFDYSPIYDVDFIWKGNDVPFDIVGKIADNEKLWGRGVEAPLVALEGFKVYGNQINLYGVEKGKPTINIKMDDGSSIVKFKSSEKEYELLHSDLGYVIINAVGTCKRSNWGIPQIFLTDYEIVGRNEYYF